MNLQNIPVKVDADGEYSIGNLAALLIEVASYLERLIAEGESAMLDLNSLPLAPDEYDRLRDLLGTGEVSVHIEAIGPSEIVETRYPGVWWVTHFNVEGDIIADTLEITRIPEIVKSQPEGIEEGLQALLARLDDGVLQ